MDDLLLYITIGSIAFLLLLKVRNQIATWILSGALVVSWFLAARVFSPGWLIPSLCSGGVLYLACLFSGRIHTEAPAAESADPPARPESTRTQSVQTSRESFLNKETCKQDPVNAIAALKKMAESGSAEAWNMLGELFYDGIGTAVDKAAAERSYQQAYRRGNPDATFSLGYMYLNGDGVAEDVEQGIRYLKQAAERGSAAAFRHLGFLYFTGKKVPADLDLSFIWMLGGADRGDADAQAHVAQAFQGYMWGAPSRDYALAGKYFEKAVAQNNGHAMWCLGHNYALGINNYPKDPEKAFRYFESGAKNGSDKAELRMGLCFLRGEGTKKDPVAALRWLEKAASGGNSEMRSRYGMMLASGVGDTSAESLLKGRNLVLQTAKEMPDDKTAAKAAARITELERQHGSWEQAVRRGCGRELLSFAAAQVREEENDLRLHELEIKRDARLRIEGTQANLDAYCALITGTWDDCYGEARKALDALKNLYLPREDDRENLRKAYALLGASAYRMAVDYGVHTFRDAGEYFDKAQPFPDTMKEQLLPHYRAFKEGKLRPAQERGTIGQIDMCFFREEYNKALDLLSQLSDDDVLKLNLYSRSMLGAYLFEHGRRIDWVLESVVRDDVYPAKGKTAYAITTCLKHYYDSYRKTRDPGDKAAVDKWLGLLMQCGGTAVPAVVSNLQKDGRKYSELIARIEK